MRTYLHRKTDEEIREAIITSNSANEAIIQLGYSATERFRIRQFAKEHNISLKHFSRVNQRTYTLNEDFFKNINNQDVIYWLGFIMADGNIRHHRHEHALKVHLAIKDEQHLNKLKQSLNYNGPLRYKDPHIMTAKGHSYRAQASVTLQVTSKTLIQDLIHLDCLPNKTYVGTKISNKIPQDMIRHFIRGYFDGDGSIVIDNQKRKGKFTKPQLSLFILGSEPLLEQIRTIISATLDVNLPKISKRKGVCCIKWTGNKQAYKIFEWLYQDANIFLDRKFNVYNNFVKNYL